MFVREVTSSRGGAYLAGLAWGFGSYRFAALDPFAAPGAVFPPADVPLSASGHCWWAKTRRSPPRPHDRSAGRRLRVLRVIGALALVVGSVALLSSSGRRLTRSTVASLATSVLVAALIAGPVALIDWRVQQSQGFGRGLDEAARHAVTAAAYAHVPPGNVLYGRSGFLGRGSLLRQTSRGRADRSANSFPGSC